MTPENKQLLKVIGISTGIVLIVVSLGVIIYKSTKKRQEEDDADSVNPYLIPSATNRPTSSTKTKYTKEEIKKMQGWLVAKAVEHNNLLIINKIRDTGGIDGIIGDGFNSALNEAIAKKYVKDINDLYNKSN